MARKKQQTYGDMVRMIADVEKRMVRERERMGNIMGCALAATDAAAVLGDCSDSDLRRIVLMMAEDAGKYLDRLEAEKQAHRAAQKKMPGGAGTDPGEAARPDRGRA